MSSEVGVAPSEAEDASDFVGSDLKPSEIVSELDRFIVGQSEAKRAVAVALRTRYRRMRLPEELRAEVVPKNILMIGPTGCGKTEIARRLAKLANAPFVKVEATKFTEVGYHGRDVDTIIRDLMHNATQLVRKAHEDRMRDRVEEEVENLLLSAIIGPESPGSQRDRETWRQLLRAGELEDRNVVVNLPVNRGGNGGNGFVMDSGNSVSLRDVVEQLSRSGRPRGNETRTVTVADARVALRDAEVERQLENVNVEAEALTSCEQRGIVFIDELDKICTTSDYRGSDASAEGVQRDLLPLIEGSSIPTKSGTINTDHILFIASGAFHQSRPSDLLPELQGRLPIRVELQRLTEADLLRILNEPEANLVRQQVELMKTEGIDLEFEVEAVEEMAAFAAEINATVEHIGARRLHTVMERIMEEFSFSAPDMGPETQITVTRDMVKEKLRPLLQKGDLSKFIL